MEKYDSKGLRFNIYVIFILLFCINILLLKILQRMGSLSLLFIKLKKKNLENSFSFSVVLVKEVWVIGSFLCQ